MGFDFTQLTVGPLLAEAHHFEVKRTVVEAVTDGQFPVHLTGLIDHSAGIDGISGQGFFADHVLTRAERADGELSVRGVGQDDVDGIVENELREDFRNKAN